MVSVSHVENGVVQAPTSTSIKSVTTGFSPDVILFKATNTITTLDGTESSFGGAQYGWAHGIADLRNGKELSIFAGTGSASTNGCAIETSSSSSINILELPNDGNGINNRIKATAQTEPSGFALDFQSVGQAAYIKYKALRFNTTGNYAVGFGNFPTSATTISETGLGFEPNFIRTISQPVITGTDETTQYTNDWGLSHGWANTNKQYGMAFTSYSNNVDDHVWLTRTGSSAVVVHQSSKGGITGKSVGSVSFTSDGFDISFNTVEGTGELFMWIAMDTSEEVGIQTINAKTSTGNVNIDERFRDVEVISNATIESLDGIDGYSGSNQNQITYGWSHGSADSPGQQNVLSIGVSSNSVNQHRAVGSNSELLRLIFTDNNANDTGSDDATAADIGYYGTKIDLTKVSTESNSIASTHLENPIVLWGIRRDNREGKLFI